MAIRDEDRSLEELLQKDCNAISLCSLLFFILVLEQICQLGTKTNMLSGGMRVSNWIYLYQTARCWPGDGSNIGNLTRFVCFPLLYLHFISEVLYGKGSAADG